MNDVRHGAKYPEELKLEERESGDKCLHIMSNFMQ